jgi:hypothetical protein
MQWDSAFDRPAVKPTAATVASPQTIDTYAPLAASAASAPASVPAESPADVVTPGAPAAESKPRKKGKCSML